MKAFIIPVSMIILAQAGCDKLREKWPSGTGSQQISGQQASSSSSSSVEHIPSADFRCQEHSSSLVRYNEQNLKHEFCKKGSWVTVPSTPETRFSDERMMAAKPATYRPKTRQRKKVYRPNAYRCRSSRIYENSYICRRSTY